MTDQQLRTRKLCALLWGALAIVILAALIAVLAGQGAKQPEEAEATPPPEPLPAEAAAEGSSEVDPSAWYLKLVRNELPLEPGFTPELEEVERGEMFDSRAVSALRVMIAEARADGYSVYVCSCFRSYDVQYEIYWNHVEEYQAMGLSLADAEAKTRLAVNYPGASEHQLGLAADILEYEDQPMEPDIGGQGLMLWLEEHCADYGFIIRYPRGKTEITGVEYEPWHLRYVGDAASYIMENGLCLEEFLAPYGVTGLAG